MKTLMLLYFINGGMITVMPFEFDTYEACERAAKVIELPPPRPEITTILFPVCFLKGGK